MTESYDIFAYFITENFNNIIENSIFEDSLKQADIKQVYRKDPRNEDKNYRPVSILPNLSKTVQALHVSRWTSTSTLFFLNTYLDFERDILHINVYLLWHAGNLTQHSKKQGEILHMLYITKCF